MNNNFEELLPEITMITNEKIRSGVKSAIRDALNYGWSDLSTIPFINSWQPEVDTGLSLIDHTRLVTKLMIAMAKELGEKGFTVNLDELIAAGILHDMGLLIEFEQKDNTIVQRWNKRLIRHPHWGMYLAQRNDLPISVVHAVAVHSKEGDFIERNRIAGILYHADWLVFGITTGVFQG